MWTEELREYLKANFATVSTAKISEKFGVPESSVRTLAYRMGLKKSRKWTKDMDARLVEMYADTDNRIIAETLGSTPQGVASRAAKLGVHKSKEFMLMCAHKSCFKKGHIPANKGLKQTEFMSAEAIERTKVGRFKKGDMPSNLKNEGYERVNSYGYVEVKQETGFAFKHILLWEKEYGPVPEGHMVTFKDRDKSNITLENLELITKEENMRRNSIHNLPPEIVKTCQTIGRLKRKINQIEKQERKW